MKLDRIRLMSNRNGDKHLLAKLPRTKILTDDKCNCKKSEKYKFYQAMIESAVDKYMQ